MGAEQSFFNFLIIYYIIVGLVWCAITFAWIYGIYYCCTKHILNKVSNQQFDKLVARHETNSNQIGELRQTKAQHQVALKQLQKDLKEIKTTNKKTLQKVDTLFNRLNGSRITNNVSEQTLQLQKQSESEEPVSSHND